MLLEASSKGDEVGARDALMNGADLNVKDEVISHLIYFFVTIPDIPWFHLQISSPFAHSLLVTRIPVLQAGFQPLHLAIMGNHIAVTKLLLQVSTPAHLVQQ